MNRYPGRFYGHIFRHFLYPLYEEYLRGRRTLKWVREAAVRDHWTAAAVDAWQLDCLRKLLRHAADQVPWYGEQIRNSGLIPEEITSVSDLSVLPVLTKELVREHYDDLIARNYRGTTFTKSTGGSTGEPFRFETTRADYERRMAVMWRGYGRAGAWMGRRTLYLWGSDILPSGSIKGIKNRLYHGVFQRRMLNSFLLSRDNIHDYYRAVNDYRPEIIVAYVSPLYHLASYILEHRLSVAAPVSILTGAEPLYEYQRERIEAAFGCPVYNTYGCREVMLIASEAPGVDKLLINADQLVLETLDGAGVPVEGEPGELLITDLHAYGMPLIRYRNGDVATLCHRDMRIRQYPWPLMESVDGRRLDVIQTLDGHLLPGEFFPHLMKDIPGVEQFQIVQKRVDNVHVRIVPGQAFTQGVERQLESTIRQYLGAGMHLRLERVNEIPLTQSGKRRVTISEIGN